MTSLRTLGFVLASTLLIALAAVLAASPLETDAGPSPQQFNVTKTDDTADATCDELDCSLREAIRGANSAGSGVINVPAGTYILTIPGDEDAAAAGDLDITSNVTITGAGPEPLAIGGAGSGATIIDGNQLDGAINVLPGASLTMSGVTVRNGRSGGWAGGIFADGNLTLTNVHVMDNSGFTANGFAPTGGVGAAGPVTMITDSVISGNSTTGEESTGGLWVAPGSDATITDTVISMNDVHDENSVAGAWLSGEVLLEGVTVSGNRGLGDNMTAGIYAFGVVTINQSQIINNTVSGTFSVGGIRTDTAMTITDSVIRGNQVPDSSVAGILARFGTLNLERVAITNNSGGTMRPVA